MPAGYQISIPVRTVAVSGLAFGILRPGFPPLLPKHAWGEPICERDTGAVAVRALCSLNPGFGRAKARLCPIL